MPFIDDKKLTRALILNALVLPGSGHIFIGSKLLGSTLAAATIIFLLAPIIRFLAAFSEALKTPPQPGITGSLGLIAAAGKALSAHWAFILLCFLAVILIWIYGISDIAMRIKRGKTSNSNDTTSDTALEE